MNTVFTKAAEDWVKKVAELKSKSEIWPNVLMQVEDNTYYFSTLVHFEFRGIIFSRHHVESAIVHNNADHQLRMDILHKTQLRLKHYVDLALNLAIPTSYDQVVRVNNLDKSIENGKKQSTG